MEKLNIPHNRITIRVVETCYQCYISKTDEKQNKKTKRGWWWLWKFDISNVRFHKGLLKLSNSPVPTLIMPKYICTEKKNYGLTLIFTICFVLGYRKVRGKIDYRKLTSNYGLPLALIDFFFSWTQYIKEEIAKLK